MTADELLRVLEEVMRHALYLPHDVKERARAAIQKTKIGNRPTKHTPGPWRVEKDGSIRTKNGKEVFSIRGDSEGQYIAALHSDHILIAAAPDLLAACEQLSEAQRRADAGEHGGFELYVDAVDAARAAIKRAKEET